MLRHAPGSGRTYMCHHRASDSYDSQIEGYLLTRTCRAVRLRSVLARLPLTLYPADLELDPDGPLEHPGHEVCRRVRDAPGLGPPGLVLARQLGDVPQQPLRVVDGARPAVDVDQGVV